LLVETAVSSSRILIKRVENRMLKKAVPIVSDSPLHACSDYPACFPPQK
jgi:hypothetical protein